MKKIFTTLILFLGFLIPIYSEKLTTTSRFLQFNVYGYGKTIQLKNCFLTEITPVDNGYYKLSYTSYQEGAFWNVSMILNGSIYVKEGDKIIYNETTTSLSEITAIVKGGGYNFIELGKE